MSPSNGVDQGSIGTPGKFHDPVGHGHGPFAPVAVDNPQLTRLQAVLDRFEITIAEAHDLVALEGYELVVICDDSGSMGQPAAPPSQRQLGKKSMTRWEELRETVSLIVEIGSCFAEGGIQVLFLNRPGVQNVKSSTDPRFASAFQAPPRGGTPLTETLRSVAQQCASKQNGGERPVLLFILTDGEPNGGTAGFKFELRRLVRKESTSHTFRVQIMACTGDEEAVGWLDQVDREFHEIDVTDDYYSEMVQVLKDARKVRRFTRADWCMKAMLGPISAKFDGWDERQVAPSIDFGGKTQSLEEACSCNKNAGCIIA
mmetsp:Transcript_48685/g.136153  ORF Transcript_48685/g.136153 Transcript_48685/m.136153 type:complete len:315 (-) Transcript_48685:208-1152(-)|eukprot:CAMPEP_0117506930 /NCGR_PEP_ID=MMETSP0784-20121206/26164_1 /TAXON_ID=39447 /ORGANISM="" /LENGTH=314 /DNA_ID=CAMNT_0005302423 /DNA_START=70 /DNA_END=1014 /DNA_ORIENTATION=-